MTNSLDLRVQLRIADSAHATMVDVLYSDFKLDGFYSSFKLTL